MTKDINVQEILNSLGIKEVNNGACTGVEWIETNGKEIASYSPGCGSLLAKVKQASWDDYEALRKNKEALAKLVSLEMGKIYQEGLGEVQEMIDICDFAVGQSRQLYGFTMHSERPQHRMYDQYHPLGVVGVISAFNFPVAVWAWNTMLALIAGDTVIWKPSSKTPLTAVAVHNIMTKVLKDNNLQEGIINLVVAGSRILGDDFIGDKRVPLISVTGSTAVGKRVAEIVGKRLGKTICELGGNNAIIISDQADLDMALTAAVFGAVGTTGQRCTSTRRLIIQEDIYDSFVKKLVNAYGQLDAKTGHSLDPNTLVGPMIDKNAVEDYKFAIKQAKKEGGKILFGNKVHEGEGYESGCYVQPTLIEAQNSFEIVQEETFAPILYLLKYKTLDDAIEMHNDVPQGLSSAIFTKNMLESERFLSHAGSDCGIANVNIGTSGAEIGGAFGGEKDTGGGRESGSDSWKIYMRRQTNTINFGTSLPLAQGIKFDF